VYPQQALCHISHSRFVTASSARFDVSSVLAFTASILPSDLRCSGRSATSGLFGRPYRIVDYLLLASLV